MKIQILNVSISGSFVNIRCTYVDGGHYYALIPKDVFESIYTNDDCIIFQGGDNYEI